MARTPGKLHKVRPVGTVYLWLYTTAAVDKIRRRLEDMNARGGHAHSIAAADLTLLFKTGVPVMQPNPRRRKDAVLYVLEWKPAEISVRNFYASDYDSRMYNWLYDLYKGEVSGDIASVEELKTRTSWAAMVDHATHPTVEHPIPFDLVDDPSYNPDEHQSSRD